VIPFGRFVAEHHAEGRLVVQPRMGFGEPAAMRAGLLRTKAAAATVAGTITLDSYTRVGDHVAAARALADGAPLNGFPIVAHGPEVTGRVLAGVADATFPVQVRHGCALPSQIFAALVASGLDATEGGPVSYCLPYSRTPLRVAMRDWVRACEVLLAAGPGTVPHIETFGGCMLGQLCPPSMLVAISALEALFFAQQGIRSVSLSYAQQTDTGQDEEAVGALHRLAGELLLPDVDRHIVLYAYMGKYPRTAGGAARLLAAATRLAVRSDAARLMVKTEAESRRIPTIDENIAALELAGEVAAQNVAARGLSVMDSEVYEEARALVDAVLDIDGSMARALPVAFERGHLDIPYCLHPDNQGRARGVIDDTGRLRWSSVGSLPIRPPRGAPAARLRSAELIDALSFMERTYDREFLDGRDHGRLAGGVSATVAGRAPLVADDHPRDAGAAPGVARGA
jgi:methylaspartate mutase epsilon subunit